MDRDKIASELVRLAKELTASVRILPKHKAMMDKLIRKYQSRSGDVTVDEFQRPIINFDDLDTAELDSWLSLMVKVFKQRVFEDESQESLAFAFNDLVDETGLRYPRLRA